MYKSNITSLGSSFQLLQVMYKHLQTLTITTLMPGTIHQSLSTFKPSAMGGPKDWIPSYLSKVTPGIYNLALVSLNV